MYFREEIDKMREASFDFGKKPPVDGYTKVTEKSVYTKEKVLDFRKPQRLTKEKSVKRN